MHSCSTPRTAPTSGLECQPFSSCARSIRDKSFAGRLEVDMLTTTAPGRLVRRPVAQPGVRKAAQLGNSSADFWPPQWSGRHTAEGGKGRPAGNTRNKDQVCRQATLCKLIQAVAGQWASEPREPLAVGVLCRASHSPLNPAVQGSKARTVRYGTWVTNKVCSEDGFRLPAAPIGPQHSLIWALTLWRLVSHLR